MRHNSSVLLFDRSGRDRLQTDPHLGTVRGSIQGHIHKDRHSAPRVPVTVPPRRFWAANSFQKVVQSGYVDANQFSF